MPAGNQSCLVMPIVFDSMCKVCTCLLVVQRRSVSSPLVDEGFVFIDLVEFQFFSISPFGVAISFVEFHCLFMVLRHKEATHVCGFGPEGV